MSGNVNPTDRLAEVKFQSDIVESFGVGTRQIDPFHRIVAPEEPMIKEFYSDLWGARLIAMPEDGPDSTEHRRLQELEAPVFSALQRAGTEELLVLWVPDGTQPVSSTLQALTRSRESLFSSAVSVGRALHKIHEVTGSPVPARRRRIIDQLAFVTQENIPEGAHILWSPPYVFDADMSRARLFEELDDEIRTKLVAAQDQEAFAEGLLEGWDDSDRSTS